MRHASPTLVCTFPSDSFCRLSHLPVVICAEADPHSLASIEEAARRQSLVVRQVWLRSTKPLSDLESVSRLEGARVVVEVPGIGSMSQVIARIKEWRTPNVTFLLTPASARNCVGAQILASLGVAAGVNILAGQVDWEACSELASYAFYSTVRRAPVEPFHSLLRQACRRRESDHRIDFGRFFCESPARFLHVSNDGRVALTSESLRRQEFLCDEVGSIGKCLQSAAYVAAASEWSHRVLRQKECAGCSGWSLCRGRFDGNERQRGQCAEFFGKVGEAMEFHRGLRQRQQAS